MRGLIVFCLVSLLLNNITFSQQPNFKNYAGEILPSGNVYTAFQDSRGFMWFGTDRGAVRFDGYSFVTYTTLQGLSDNEIFNFYEDRAGRIWFLTMNGKLSYWKNDEIFNNTSDPVVKKMEFASAISGMLEDEDGNLWVSSTKDGVTCVHVNGEITRFLDDGTLGSYTDYSKFNRINCTYGIFQSAPHEFILLKRVAMFKIKFNDDNTKVIRTERLEDSPYFENMPKMMKSSASECVFKNYDEVYNFDFLVGKKKVAYRVTPGEVVFNLSQDRSRFWFCTSVGAISYDKTTRVVGETFLKEHRITSVMQDHEGNYWFTTLGQGIFFCTSLSMNGYDVKSGLRSEMVNCLARDERGRVWIGYGRGKSGEPGAVVSYIQNQEIKHLHLSYHPYLRRMSTLQIQPHGDRQWISTSTGLIRYDGKFSMRQGFTRCAIEYPEDKIWFGSSGNLSRTTRDTFDIDAHQFNLMDPETLMRKIHPGTIKEALDYVRGKIFSRNNPINVKAILLDAENRLWAGNEKHLYRGDSTNSNFEVIFPTTSELQVNDIVELDKDLIVAATSGGGIVFIEDSKHTRTIDQDLGMSSNICNALTIDVNKVIWVATNEGLNRISGFPDRVEVEYFDVNDGLMSNEVTDVLIANDTVWVATKGGVNFFHKDSLRKHHGIPIMYIDRITVDGKPVARSTEHLTFNYNENDLSIHYTGLSFSNGSKIIYRYKLHPEDPWRFTKNTSVYLPALSSGDYQFIVSSKGRLNEWSKEVSITFSIEPPFWKSISFIVLCVLVFLFLTWIGIAAIESRRRRIMEQSHRVTLSELKSLRAQMNPHFLFNALNSIQGVLMKRNFEEAQDYLGRFGKLMRTILDHADKSSISISEELDSITNYLEIEQLRATQFQYKIEIDPDLDIYNQEIPAMIIQPFIENAIWHGFANKDGHYLLIIKFQLTPDDTLLIEIRDNGIGRRKAMAQRSSTHKSKGMQLVKERIDILNYKAEQKIALHIFDLEGEAGEPRGTSVRIIIPVNN